jgi:hypothetical protein
VIGRFRLDSGWREIDGLFKPHAGYRPSRWHVVVNLLLLI